MERILVDQRKRLEGAVHALQTELEAVRTGQATPALLNHVRVEAYGDKLPLIQLASVSATEGRFIVVTPWDRSMLPTLERAILTSDLGLTPSNDGQVIRLQIPQLTEERRTELSKVVARKAEEARVAVRNIRRDVIATLEKRQKSEGWSDDEVEVGKKEAQKATDAYVEKVDKIVEVKTKDIMTL